MKTKINMNIETLEMIEYGSNLLQMSRTALIKILLKYFEAENKQLVKLFSQVRYQDTDIKENWHPFHFNLTEAEYEHFTDMRKFCKMSFSLIVAFAVENYLEIVLDPKNCSCLKKSGKGDNWPSLFFPAYAFLQKLNLSIS